MNTDIGPHSASRAHPGQVWGGTIQALDRDREKQVHTHPTGVLTGVERGILRIQAGKELWIAPAGTVVHLPAETPHALHMLPGYEGWYLCLPPDTAFLPSGLRVLAVSDLLLAAVRRLAELDPARPHTPAQGRWAGVVMDELREARPAPFLHIPMPEAPALRRVARALLNAPGDMGELDGWARRAAMSRRTFTRRFHAETGLSFVAWRQRVKVHAALQALSEGQSVGETAYDLGYQTVSAFIEVFRKHLGAPPRSYVARNLRAYP